jgi:protein-arginine kinase activator protein McsA
VTTARRRLMTIILSLKKGVRRSIFVVIPNALLNIKTKMNILLEKLKVAIENEDFNLAAKLQKEINEIRKLYDDFFGPNHQEEVNRYLNSFNK